MDGCRAPASILSCMPALGSWVGIHAFRCITQVELHPYKAKE